MPRRNDDSSPPPSQPSFPLHATQRPAPGTAASSGQPTPPNRRPRAWEQGEHQLVLRRDDDEESDTELPALPMARLLVVSEDGFWRARIGAAVADLSVRVEVVPSARGAREWMRCMQERGTGATTLLVIDMELPDARGDDLAQESKCQGFAALLACQSPSLDDAVCAMRAGASDLLSRTTPMRDLSRRVEAALERAVASRRQEQRIVRLKRICRRLRTARDQVARQVDSLCTDLVHAYQELAEHMNQVSTASEFGSLIRQELDLESLLRSTLEFILSKSGPTNAAVFLPATSGDFSLGAYVNYDCPKETIDILLDHMANAVAPRLQDVPAIEHLTERAQVEKYMAGDAAWIGDSHMVAFSCRHEGECLAIFLLFRDSKMVYADGLLPQLKTVRDLFAAQLAKVIKIHHRHIPKEKWGALGDMDEPRGDDYGLAA
jgi:DNA-binding response OmpR family regulator